MSSMVIVSMLFLHLMIMDRKKRLREYRSHNAKVAIYRDNDQCVICYFREGVTTPSTQVHHIYGRGRDRDDGREHYTNLMCVCNACHPQPIKHEPAGDNLAWVEKIADRMNETPINKEFQHIESLGVFLWQKPKL